MLRALALVVAALVGWGTPSPAGAEGFGGLPEGAGQEETYDACAACHSIRLVVQQRLDRESWDETLAWMVEEQGMPELESEARSLILDYLSTHLSRDAPRWTPPKGGD
jgi:mono/diheme cytochrome c family protein